MITPVGIPGPEVQGFGTITKPTGEVIPFTIGGNVIPLVVGPEKEVEPEAD